MLWPDASADMHHYLENTGSPQNTDVDGMLDDLPGLNDKSQVSVEGMAELALTGAQASGATGPVTYPFSTSWDDGHASSGEDRSWFLATGGYQYCAEGTVTVYPPTDVSSERTYSYDYRVHVADRNNRDQGKFTSIAGYTITDAEPHRAGIARVASIEPAVSFTASCSGGWGHHRLHRRGPSHPRLQRNRLPG